MRSSKWSGNSLNFQFNGIIIVSPDANFNGIIIVSPDGNIPPFETKPYKPVEHKVVRTESKNFACESLWVIGSSAISICHLILGPVNPGYGWNWILAMGEIAPCIRY